MCVIVDASVAGRVFSTPHDADFQPLWRWLTEEDGKLVYGGYLVEELNRIPSAARRLAELKRSGRALECPRKKIEQEELAVRRLRLCRSNDHHVIALAHVSGARVLCANDHKLEDDFKNMKIVPRPKGQVYKTARHAHLLTHNSVCIGRPRS